MTTHLGADAVTAYRLAMLPDGTVPIAHMMSAWNTIDRREPRHAPADLPEGMRREGDRVISDVEHAPLRLEASALLWETLRLSHMHRAPDADGWYNVSDVVRTANGLGAKQALAEAGDTRGVTQLLRDHPLLETRLRGDVLLVRHRLSRPEDALGPVATEVLCPGDAEPRVLDERPTFGAAYRALLAMQRDLVANGTTVRFHRGEEERTATYDVAARWWIMADGSLMRRRDEGDPILHHYRHGHLVEAVIGFVSVSKTGRIFATVGRPVDEPGDDDAFIHTLDRKEAATAEEALELLASRGDLDHVFQGVQRHDSTMGFWLSGLED